MRRPVRVAEFFIEGKKGSTGHALLHLSDPTPSDKNNGQFFALFFLEEATPDDLLFIQSCIETVESAYYTTPAHEELSAFEVALTALKKRSGEDLGDLMQEIPVSFLFGVAQHNRLSCCVSGEMGCSLISSSGELTSIYQKAEDVPPLEEIIEGPLLPRDTILVTSQSFFDVFSPGRISKLLASKTPEEAAQHIQKSIAALKPEHAVAGLFLHCEPRTSQSRRQVGSEASLTNLVDQAKKTEETLSPPLLSSLRSLLKGNSGTSPGRRRAPKGKSEILMSLLRGLGATLMYVGLALYALLRRLGDLLWQCFVLTTNWRGGRASVLQRMTRNIQQKRDAWRRLPKLSKILLIGALVSLVAFVLFTFSLRVAQQRRANLAQQRAQLATAQEQLDTARGHLIYGNEPDALAMLARAEDTVTNLAQAKGIEASEVALLEEDIAELLLDLRKMEIVSSTLLISLTDIAEPQRPTGMAAAAESILLYSAQSPSYVYEGQSTLRSVAHESFQGLHSHTTAGSASPPLVSTYGGALAAVDLPVGGFAPVDIQYVAESPQIVDIARYNNRLYTFDQSTNQLYRHSQTQLGFDRGSAWISGHQPTDEVLALDIDGSIYLLTQESILVYLKGQQVDTFSLSPIDPAPSKPGSLYVSSENDLIVFADHENPRIILMNKSGTLRKQIQDPAWTAIRDIAVNEEQKTITVLTDTALLRVSYTL